MPSYKNFQSDNKKHTESRNHQDPSFTPTVSARGELEMTSFEKSIHKYSKFLSWMRFYPDLFLDLITPEKGGIRLGLDQRVFLRSLFRFVSNYGVFPRGYGKTFIGILAMYLVAMAFPNIDISMSAQTLENASKLLKAKHREITKFYPLIEAEIIKFHFAKGQGEIHFTSGSMISILANSQSTKGARKHRLNIEESNLLNNVLFEDVLEPIPNIPRLTVGSNPEVNPEELNGQINFFTTSGFKGTDEHSRSISMVKNMAELKGELVLGADFELGCFYKRGEPRSSILAKKERLSPVAFARNYGSKWVGVTDGALVDIGNLISSRTILKPESKGDGKSEYYVSMDIARSSKASNNQSSIVVLKAIRNKKNNRIKQIHIVNIIHIPNFLNFEAQAIKLKEVKYLFDAKAVVVDVAGLGKGIQDELIKEHIDPVSGTIYPCWALINQSDYPEVKPDDPTDFDKCYYGMTAASSNTDIIVNFIDLVSALKIRLLSKHEGSYEVEDEKYIEDIVAPMVQTDFFIDEIANLKLARLNNGNLTVIQQTKGVDKDRYSAVAYGCYYIMEYENKLVKAETNNSCFNDLLSVVKIGNAYGRKGG